MPKRDPKPWEQQKGEPIQSFRNFTLYRDMQSRSLAKLAGLIGTKPRLLEQMSSKYGWVKRAESWDTELDQRIRQMTTKDLGGMYERHIQLGMGMQTAVVKELRALVNRVENASNAARKLAEAEGKDPNKAFHKPVLSVNELVRLSEHGINLERLSRGETTDKVGIVEEADLSALSVKELRLLKDLQKKIG